MQQHASQQQHVVFLVPSHVCLPPHADHAHVQQPDVLCNECSVTTIRIGKITAVTGAAVVHKYWWLVRNPLYPLHDSASHSANSSTAATTCLCIMHNTTQCVQSLNSTAHHVLNELCSARMHTKPSKHT
eukprot:19182-Heterococcus_DN1.PRE.5